MGDYTESVFGVKIWNRNGDLRKIVLSIEPE